MELCPAGIICIVICLFIALRKKKFFFNMVLFSAVLQIFIEKGFLYKSGETEQVLITLPLLILSAYSLFNLSKIPTQLQNKWICLIGCYCLSILLLLLFPSNVWAATGGGVTWDSIILQGIKPEHPTVNNTVISFTIKLILCSIIYLYVYIKWEFYDYRNFLSKLSYISNFFLVFGLIEFAVKNIMMLNNMWGDISLAFWGDTDFTVHAGRQRGFFYESCLWTKESSHYAYSLFCVALIKFANNVVSKKRIIIDFWVVLCFVLMFLSTSFSSINMTLSFGGIYFAYRWGVLKSNAMKFEMLIAGFLVFMFVFVSSASLFVNVGEGSFIGDRLSNLIANFGNYMTLDASDGGHIDVYGDVSTYIRTLSVFQTLKIFLERPLFGYSLGSVICHGATPTFLAHVGVVGLICWLNFYLLKCPLTKYLKVRPFPYYIGIIIFLACNFFNGVSVGMRFFYLMMPLIFCIVLGFIFSKNES